jgi:hypothetical protein
MQYTKMEGHWVQTLIPLSSGKVFRHLLGFTGHFPLSVQDFFLSKADSHDFAEQM